MTTRTLAYRLTHLWPPLHLACMVALALQPSSPAVLFGRYSRNAAVIWVGLAVALPLMWWARRWLAAPAPPRRAPIRVLLLALTCGAVFVLWAAPGASSPPYTVLRFYLTVIAASGALWAMGAPPATHSRGWRVAVPALTLLTVAGLFGVILGFPGVRYIDEAYMASLSWNFAQTGRIEPLIYEAVDTESYALMYLGLGGWFRVFGFGLWTARAFIYTVGLAALAVTWWTARRCYGDFGAWGAVLLGAFALVPLNLLRQDVSVALYLALALAVYVVAVEADRPPLHLAVGFFVAFATDGHPNAYRFSFAFGAAYLLEWALLWRARRGFFWYAPVFYLVAGGVLGVAAYIGLYTALGDDLLSLAATPFLDPTKTPLLVLLDQLTEAVNQTPLLFGVASAGLVVGLVRRRPLARLLAVVLLVNMAIIAVLYGYYRSYYVAQSVSLYALLAASLLGELPREAGERVRVWLALLVIAANCGYLLNRYRVVEFRENFNAALVVGEDLRELLPAGGTVVATDPMYFGLVDHVTFVEYASAGWAAGKFDVPERRIWEEAAPDYVVMAYNNPERPPASLIAYADARGAVPVACWQSARIGRVDLLALGTDAAPPSLTLTCKEIR